MKDLLQLIARSLVDQPDQIEIETVVKDDREILEMRVAREDLGKVIGKQGRTARAIRTVLASAATKSGKRVGFEIVE